MEHTPPGPGEEKTGLGRRDVIRRGAILGGALVWTTPIVQTLAAPAFAAGGSPCVGCADFTNRNGSVFIQVKPTKACCDCIAANDPGGPAGTFIGLGTCLGTGACQVQNSGTGTCP